jgi:hypothetical protein
MEGFETRGNIPATTRDLADQGYTSQQRGGAVHVRKGIRIDHVIVLRGLNLPTCVLAQWLEGTDLQKLHIGIKEFATEDELNLWLREWDIRLSRHTRRIAQS